MESTTPLISIITTVKNRLHHLQQTLPLMVKQSNSEVIVVDYGCEQGSRSWVNSNYENVKVAEYREDSNFCLSCARNIGAKYAKGKFLLFLDVDYILKGDLGKWIEHNASESSYYQVRGIIALISESLFGAVLCSKKSFLKIGGYDEAFRFWGGDDVDLYYRLRAVGIKKSSFPSSFIEAIEHGDEERFLDDEIAKKDAVKANLTYMQIKYDISYFLKTAISLEQRKLLLKRVKDEIKQASQSKEESRASIKIEILPVSIAQVVRTITYKF